MSRGHGGFEEESRETEDADRQYNEFSKIGAKLHKEEDRQMSWTENRKIIGNRSLL